MILDNNIIKEGTPSLKEPSKKINHISNDILNLIYDLKQYLDISYNDELIKKYNIRPGVGIAAPQVGKNIRIFAMKCYDFLDNDKLYDYVFINPEIISKSKELTYLPDGEGCLSVIRDTNKLVTPRHYEIKFSSSYYDFKDKKIKKTIKTFKGYPAIVFQHEYDHLDGILYTDKLFDKNTLPYPPLYVIKNDNQDEK